MVATFLFRASGMALGPILGGIINNLLSIKFFYPTMLIIIPLTVVVFALNRRIVQFGNNCYVCKGAKDS